MSTAIERAERAEAALAAIEAVCRNAYVASEESEWVVNLVDIHEIIAYHNCERLTIVPIL